VGAAARNTAVAEHRAVRARYPVLTRAIAAGADGARSGPVTEFHRLPEDHPEIETVLNTGELITAVACRTR
jgi:CO/xanthine dehydrogenase FAD-binding subunit